MHSGITYAILIKVRRKTTPFINQHHESLVITLKFRNEYGRVV